MFYTIIGFDKQLPFCSTGLPLWVATCERKKVIPLQPRFLQNLCYARKQFACYKNIRKYFLCEKDKRKKRSERNNNILWDFDISVPPL